MKKRENGIYYLIMVGKILMSCVEPGVAGGGLRLGQIDT